MTDPNPMMAEFLARVIELTGELPDEDDLIIFDSPGWVHIIQTKRGANVRARKGWCSLKKLSQHLPRMVKEKWPE